VKTFNAIAPTGLEKFPQGKYKVAGEESDLPGPPMAIMLRSHKLQVNEVKPTVRAIVRCGAGTNNIPVKEMGERGIPVFNTPGANANAVKELVVCGLLLASRGILEGANHVKNVINVEEKGEHEKIATRIEKDKAKFGGTEIQGKTIGVIGLGAIGSRYVVFFCCCVLYFYLLLFGSNTKTNGSDEISIRCLTFLESVLDSESSVIGKPFEAQSIQFSDPFVVRLSCFVCSFELNFIRQQDADAAFSKKNNNIASSTLL